MSLNQYFLNEKNLILVAEPNDQELFRAISGLEQSYFQLLQQTQSFSCNIKNILRHKLNIELDTRSLSAVRKPTLTDFQKLTQSITGELKKLQSLLRIALSDEQERIKLETERSNMELVVEVGDGVRQLASVIFDPKLLLTQQQLPALKTSLKQLYRLFEFKCPKTQFSGALKKYRESLPDISTLKSTRKQINTDTLLEISSEELKVELQRYMRENEELKKQIDRLEDYLVRFTPIRRQVYADSYKYDSQIKNIRHKLDRIVSSTFKPVIRNYTLRESDKQRMSTTMHESHTTTWKGQKEVAQEKRHLTTEATACEKSACNPEYHQKLSEGSTIMGSMYQHQDQSRQKAGN